MLRCNSVADSETILGSLGHLEEPFIALFYT